MPASPELLRTIFASSWSRLTFRRDSWIRQNQRYEFRASDYVSRLLQNHQAPIQPDYCVLAERRHLMVSCTWSWVIVANRGSVIARSVNCRVFLTPLACCGRNTLKSGMQGLCILDWMRASRRALTALFRIAFVGATTTIK